MTLLGRSYEAFRRCVFLTSYKIRMGVDGIRRSWLRSSGAMVFQPAFDGVPKLRSSGTIYGTR